MWSLVATGTGRAKATATLTASPTAFGATAGQNGFSASIRYAAGVTPTALGFTGNLPEGWAQVSTGGAQAPQIRPPRGATGALEYAYTTSPATPATFTVTVSYPAGLSGNRTISSSAVDRDTTLVGALILALPDLTLTGPAAVTPAAPTITTPPPGSSAQTYGIVGPAGQAFVLTQSGATFDAGTGSVDATGRIVVTTAAQQTLAATVSAELARITAAMTDAKRPTTPFAGFGAHAPELGEQRLVTISTRTTAEAGDEVAIVGFTLTGIESKPVLIRAVGPRLGSFGVATALTAPRLVLNRDAAVVGRNTGWTTSGTTVTIVAAAARSEAFPLGVTSADSVPLLTLAPGAYTAVVVSAADDQTGVGLGEVYDLSGASVDQRLTNIFTRAVAGAGMPH